MGWKGESERHSYSRRGGKTRKDVDVTPKTALKNLKMDDNIYKLRSKVMKHIYEAKELCEFPRITIRITEDVDDILGRARMKDNVIWIPKKSLEDKYDLRSIVYHEILHAVYGVEHVNNCPLMSPYHMKMSKSEADRLFKKYAKEYGCNCK
jgi:hypothetical protein